MKIKLDNVEQVNGGLDLRRGSLIAKHENDNQVKEYHLDNVTKYVYPDGSTIYVASY